jgi:HEAT repeat protein
MWVDAPEMVRYLRPAHRDKAKPHRRVFLGDRLMHAIQPLLLALGMLLGEGGAPVAREPDLAHLKEMLHDRQHALSQGQAALLLVQSTLDGAEKAVRDGLRGTETVDVFLPLAAAVALARDRRFLDELFAALSAPRSAIRASAAQTLAVLADAPLVTRLQKLADDEAADGRVREMALRTLGCSGRKQAARFLLGYLSAEEETLRRAAAAALHDLSGQDFGLDADRWQSWWEAHKHLTEARWLESRLSYQMSRADRLEGDLARSRSQVLHLQQQLYSRLSAVERVNHILSLREQDDPAVRTLAVNWSVELLPTAEPAQKRLLAHVLLRLSHDSAVEVQRAAVFGLGRVNEPGVFERLLRLAETDRPAVRSVALHALAVHAQGSEADSLARRKQIMPLLQKALDDPALEVVVEAAEDLGTLGAREAGPVLVGLLRHPSKFVREAAAQALERVAEPSVLPGLLGALDDSCATVRFNLVGAMAHAAGGNGARLTAEQRKRLLERWEKLLLGDSDPGVRSRAATALGEWAPPEHLGTLWRCVLAAEDARVQEKAWNAFVEILTRAGRIELLQEWERTLTAARQGPRRVQMLFMISARWQGQPERKALIVPAQEMLVQAQLDIGKWSAAAPLVRDLLTRPAGEVELNRRLSWLLTVGEQALHEGNRGEALRAVETAQSFLPRTGKLADAFARLEKEASRKE